MAKKTYYLFKIPIWSVIVELDEDTEADTDPEEESDGTGSSLTAQITTPTEERPQIGFTPWTPPPWGDDWEDKQ